MFVALLIVGTVQMLGVVQIRIESMNDIIAAFSIGLIFTVFRTIDIRHTFCCALSVLYADKASFL